MNIRTMSLVLIRLTFFMRMSCFSLLDIPWPTNHKLKFLNKVVVHMILEH